MAFECVLLGWTASVTAMYSSPFALLSITGLKLLQIHGRLEGRRGDKCGESQVDMKGIGHLL